MKNRISLLILLCIPIILFGCGNADLAKIKETRLLELKELISIGTDIDQAVAIIEKSDFKIFQGKLKPTGTDGNYFSVIVLLINDYSGPSFKSTLYEVTGWSVFYEDFSPYAEIKAHLNGEVFSIE